MSEAASHAPGETARATELSGVARFMKATELDTRMLGMVGALLIIWVVFHFLSGGLFLTPRNLWNLSVQSASVAIMATGMVLVIVTRNIDLSIGSVLGFVGMVMGVTQAEFLPGLLGFGSPAIWVVALLVGVVAGVAIGAAVGLLFAPRSGKETRKQIKRRAKQARKDLVDMVEKARGNAGSAMADAVEEAGKEVSSKAKRAAEAVRQSAN